MYFKASLDNLSIIISVIVVALLLYPLFSQLFFIVKYREFDWSMLSVLLILAIIIVPWLFKTSGYLLGNDNLEIVRPVGNKVIPFAEVKYVRQVTEEDMAASIRTFAVGGYFGYYGKYRSPRLGNFTMFTTRRDNRIILFLMDESKIVISPDGPELYNLLMEKVK